MLVQNLTEGPDGRATALDSKRLWANLMTAERVYQQLWRAELSRRLGLEFVEVPDHEQQEIKGWEDKALREAFSKRAAQVRAQCDAWGTTDTRTARQAARATRRAKASLPASSAGAMLRASASARSRSASGPAGSFDRGSATHLGWATCSPVIGSLPANIAWHCSSLASPLRPKAAARAPYHCPGDSPWPDRYSHLDLAICRIQ